jgi:hypothetical protein
MAAAEYSLSLWLEDQPTLQRSPLSLESSSGYSHVALATPRDNPQLQEAFQSDASWPRSPALLFANDGHLKVHCRHSGKNHPVLSSSFGSLYAVHSPKRSPYGKDESEFVVWKRLAGAEGAVLRIRLHVQAEGADRLRMRVTQISLLLPLSACSKLLPHEPIHALGQMCVTRQFARTLTDRMVRRIDALVSETTAIGDSIEGEAQANINEYDEDANGQGGEEQQLVGELADAEDALDPQSIEAEQLIEASKVARAVKRAGRAIKKRAKAAGSKVKKVATKAGRAVASKAKALGRSVKTAASRARKKVTSVASRAKKAVSGAASRAKTRLTAAARAARERARKLAAAVKTRVSSLRGKTPKPGAAVYTGALAKPLPPTPIRKKKPAATTATATSSSKRPAKTQKEEPSPSSGSSSGGQGSRRQQPQPQETGTTTAASSSSSALPAEPQPDIIVTPPPLTPAGGGGGGGFGVTSVNVPPPLAPPAATTPTFVPSQELGSVGGLPPVSSAPPFLQSSSPSALASATPVPAGPGPGEQVITTTTVLSSPQKLVSASKPTPPSTRTTEASASEGEEEEASEGESTEGESEAESSFAAEASSSGSESEAKVVAEQPDRRVNFETPASRESRHEERIQQLVKSVRRICSAYFPRYMDEESYADLKRRLDTLRGQPVTVYKWVPKYTETIVAWIVDYITIPASK